MATYCMFLKKCQCLNLTIPTISIHVLNVWKLIITKATDEYRRFIYKTLFSERIWFSKCSYEKGGFFLKEGSLGFDVYCCDRNSPRQ